MDEIQRLTSLFFDGEITDEETSRLAMLLNNDADALDQFVIGSFLHCQLLDWMDQQHADQPVAGISAEDDLDAECFECAPFTTHQTAPLPVSPTARKSPRDDRYWFQRWVHPVGALAASLLMAAGICILTYMATRPVLVGTLTDATNCRWAASDPNIPVGTFLEKGKVLDLVQGRAVITFSSGAKVFLEGPASLRLDSPTQVHLIHGLLAAKVPRQAIGFTVACSMARFIDLGTAFALDLDADKSFQLHVFEGLVELQLDERFGKAARHPVRVAEVQAVQFDVNSDDVAPLHFQEGKQMPF